jgi:hypothetical protein
LLESTFYFAGFALAIALCRGLGPLFFYPMLADLSFDLALTTGSFSGWDVRLLMAGYGFAFFLWVLALSGALARTTLLAVLALDLATIFWRVVPALRAASNGQEFWYATGTGIFELWLVSIFVVSVSTVLRSSIGARLRKQTPDLMSNPKRRFLLPIAVWAGIPPLMSLLNGGLPATVTNARFQIAAQVLVWGWTALELPHYLAQKRLSKQTS